MPIIDSRTSKIIKDYSIDQLIIMAKEMRIYNLLSIFAAGSGHTGGTLSIIDIAAALYLKVIRHDPSNPTWEERDRVFWSAGHKAPALYVALGMAGYYPIEATVKLRKLWSGFEGHPNKFCLPGIEVSSGSLGQGLGVAVGSSLRAKLDHKDYRVFCIMGDGEQQEGSIWEAAMCASHYKLDNLVGIIDLNGLQIDGRTEEVMNVEPIECKYLAFGWEVLRVDGHDIEGLIDAFRQAELVKNKPVIILADTVKGKGVSFAENVVGYHGIPPRDGRYGNESIEQAISDIFGKERPECFSEANINRILNIAVEYQKEVNDKIANLLPKFDKNYWWNEQEFMKVDMTPTRLGFGNAIARIGEDESTIAFGADITNSIKMDEFFKNHLERKKRFFNMGIAEQNMTLVAAGMAKEGKKTFIGSYGVFISGRNWDQLRTTCCYNNFNVKIAGAHGGISVGSDGATHQALEEIALMYYLPNMKIVIPCDAVETEKATSTIANTDGPCYIRYGREATPVVTKPNSVFKFGVANIIRFRNIQPNFIDAFDVFLSTDYRNENEDICIIACGPMVTEAMRTAWILKQEYEVETRIVNIHTIKPLDEECILRAANEISRIITVEEHQVGGFGNIVAGVVAKRKEYSKPFIMDMIGINDCFGESGSPLDLMIAFGLSAEQIALKAKRLLEF